MTTPNAKPPQASEQRSRRRSHRRSQRRSASDRRTRSRNGREPPACVPSTRDSERTNGTNAERSPRVTETREAPSRRQRAPPRRDRFANLRLAFRDPVAGSEYARPSSIVNRLYSVKRHIVPDESVRNADACRTRAHLGTNAVSAWRR